MDQPRVNWWWPTSGWALAILIVLLCLAALTVFVTGPLGAFASVLFYYAAFIAIRAVWLACRRRPSGRLPAVPRVLAVLLVAVTSAAAGTAFLMAEPRPWVPYNADDFTRMRIQFEIRQHDEMMANRRVLVGVVWLGLNIPIALGLLLPLRRAGDAPQVTRPAF